MFRRKHPIHKIANNQANKPKKFKQLYKINERQKPNHEAKTQKNLSKYQNQQHKSNSKPSNTPRKTSTSCNATLNSTHQPKRKLTTKHQLHRQTCDK